MVNASKLSREPRLVARVVLSSAATVTLHDPAAEPLKLEHETVQNLFVLGLQVASHKQQHRAAPKPKLTLEGRAQFFVGQVDLGRKRGLRAVRDGLEHCVGALAGELLRTSSGGSDAQDNSDGPDRDPALIDPSAEPPGVVENELYVEMWRVNDSFDAIADFAVGEGSVVLTRQGKPQLVLLAWDEHCQQQARDAQLRAAYWSAVRSGVRPPWPPDPSARSADAGAAALRPTADDAGSSHDR